MYSLKIDDDRLSVYKPNKQICEFNDENGEQKVVVRITDTDEFLRRLDKALEKYVNRNVIEYGIYGDISYCSSWISAEGMGSRSAFYKEPSYEYQNEWRICILQKLLGKTAFVLKIGDISDIIEKHSLDVFVNNIEKVYPGYTVISEAFDMPTRAYKAVGSINMTNNLMHSYMKSNNQIIRSDSRAQHSGENAYGHRGEASNACYPTTADRKHAVTSGNTYKSHSEYEDGNLSVQFKSSGANGENEDISGEISDGYGETGWENERAVFTESLRREAAASKTYSETYALSPDTHSHSHSLGADTAFLVGALSEIIDEDDETEDCTIQPVITERKNYMKKRNRNNHDSGMNMNM